MRKGQRARRTITLDVVRLDSGQISGLQQNGVWTYLGIPYVKPPTGSLRWKPPEPPKAWSGTRKCTAYGPSCPQPPSSLQVGPMSEDCLYLNVWTPAKSPSEKLPVMVWIHGGSFAFGSASQPDYQGHNLSKLGVVVVTINYRLGPFGFLAHPLFGSNKDDGTLFGAIVHAKGMTVAQYEARIQSAYGTYAPELLRMFPATSDAEVGSAYANLLTQTEFAAFARFVCQSASVKKTKVYLYQFTRVPPTQEGALLGVFHGAEMPYIFGNLSASQGYTQMDMDLSKVIMGYWTRFAASGDPNGGGQPNWPFYGPKDQNLELGKQVKVNSGLFKQACDLADKIYVGGKP